MKICTITCQNADNHGARLQCYALVRYLQDQGHEVKVIDYRPDYMRGEIPLFFLPKSLKDLIKLFVYFPSRLRARKRHEIFEAFSQKWIPRTRIYWSIEELRQDPPEADMYLAGSDQIWNTTFRNGTDPGYYLDFGPANVRRESFAASFATEQLKEGTESFVKNNLGNFDKITVREQSSLKLLNELGFRGSFQEDPVFMLSAQEWDKIADGTGIGQKYVLVYDFCNDPMIKSEAVSIAKENGLKIFAVSPIQIPYADKYFLYASPESFVSLIKNASYVISNSFHATVFSIIYKIPFKVVDRSDGLNLRMHDLLERYGY